MKRFLLAAFLLVLPCVAVAKEKTPVALQPLENFAQDNQSLQDVLDLQRQIQMISRLIERERTVNDMATAGKAIGMNDPQLSRPERTLCAQIPANILCAQAYPDLYSGYDVTPEKVEPPVIEQVMADALDEELIPVPTPAEQQLFWLDITCLQNECSALLASDPNDRNSLARVRTGQIYDGATIKAVTASGVTVERAGRTIRAKPAPKG
jgi:hypothetical protein